MNSTAGSTGTISPPPALSTVVSSSSSDTENNDSLNSQGTVQNSGSKIMSPRRIFERWVDYLPHDINGSSGCYSPSQHADKRVSLDVTESHLTESQDQSMEEADITTQDDWPDSASLEGYAMVPNTLLVENDPLLQHELLITDPTGIPSDHLQIMIKGQTPLHQVLEDRRRVLQASMEASQRTRRCLEAHIQQRASLAMVLADIEGSSQSLRQHVLPPLPPHLENDEEEDEEMLASTALEDLVLSEDDELPSPPTTNSSYGAQV
jgi:hypothetical protein